MQIIVCAYVQVHACALTKECSKKGRPPQID